MLGAALLALFGSVYYYNATGFWAAAKNPPEFVFGTLIKLWQPTLGEDTPNNIMLNVKLDGGRTIQLRGTGKLVFDCSISDKVEILKYTSDDGKRFYRLGPRACIKGSSVTKGSNTSNET